MVDFGSWSRKNEVLVLKIRDRIIAESLKAGCNVIVSDTNFDPKHEKNIRELVQKTIPLVGVDIAVEVVNFDTPLEECIKRDAARDKPVGETVIRGMWQKYLKKDPVAPIHDPSKPDAIWVDLDGTLARRCGDRCRSPYDWGRVGEDQVNETLLELVRAWAISGDNRWVTFVSGRDGCCQPETLRWLREKCQAIPQWELYMRPAGDKRKDCIVKKEIYDNQLKTKYNLLFALDDRDQVVRMVREEIGIPCYQVADGNF